jgi:hypothetical protein
MPWPAWKRGERVDQILRTLARRQLADEQREHLVLGNAEFGTYLRAQRGAVRTGGAVRVFVDGEGRTEDAAGGRAEMAVIVFVAVADREEGRDARIDEADEQ